MSALGNYIHYYKRNYFSYGTDPTMGSRGYNRTDIAQAIEQKRQTMSLAFHIKQRDKFKTQYQEALNYLHGEMKKSAETLEKETDNAVIAEFQKIVKENFPGVIMDFASMSAIRVPEEIDRMKKIKSSQTKNLSFNSLNKKLQHLYSLFQERGNDLKDRYSQGEIDIKYQLYKKVVNAVNNFYKEANSMNQDQMKKNAYVFMKSRKGSSNLGIDLTKANAQQISMIDDLNQIIAFMNGMTKSQVNGALGELSAAMAGALMAGKTAENLREFLDQSIVGLNSSYGTYIKNNFSDEFVEMEKLASKGWSYNSKNGSVTLSRPTQDKVDVAIKTGKTTKYLSVKNYNFQNGNASISLVSGVSLLSLLQNENDEDFVNHYLNITSSRRGEKSDTISHLKNYRAAMHDIVKEIILAKALTGLNIQKTMKGGKKSNGAVADYIVVNNNADRNTPFKVYSVAELLNFSGLDSNKGLAKYASIDGYDSPEWVNEGSDARSRITALIMQMHQKKLHAFASVKVFSNMLG